MLVTVGPTSYKWSYNPYRGCNPIYTDHRGPPSIFSSSALYLKHLHNEVPLYWWYCTPSCSSHWLPWNWNWTPPPNSNSSQKWNLASHYLICIYYIYICFLIIFYIFTYYMFLFICLIFYLWMYLFDYVFAISTFVFIISFHNFYICIVFYVW